MKKTMQTNSAASETRIYEQDSIAYLTLTQNKSFRGTGASIWNELEKRPNLLQQAELVYLNGLILALGAAQKVLSTLASSKFNRNLPWSEFFAFSINQYRQRRIEQAKWLIGELILIALAGLGVGCILGALGL